MRKVAPWERSKANPGKASRSTAAEHGHNDGTCVKCTEGSQADPQLPCEVRMPMVYNELVGIPSHLQAPALKESAPEEKWVFTF